MPLISPGLLNASTTNVFAQIYAMRDVLRNASRALPGRGMVELPQGMLMRLARYKTDLNAELQKMGALAMAPVRPRAIHPGERVLSFQDEAKDVIRSLDVLEGTLIDLRYALRRPMSRESEMAIGATLKLIAIADASFEQAWAGLESAVAPF